MVNKTTVVGSVASGLILIMIVLSALNTADYRNLLEDNPDANYILLDYESGKKLEFITRGIDDFLRWKYTTDEWTLYSGRYIGFKEDWIVERQRTYLQLKDVDDVSICSKVTATRCYVDDYWERSNRKATKIDLYYEEVEDNVSMRVIKNTPYYAVRSTGDGGYMTQIQTINALAEFEQFPSDYRVEYNAKDTASYRLTWRIREAEAIDNYDYPLGSFSDRCSLDFNYNMKIEWCDESNFDKAVYDAEDEVLLVHFKSFKDYQVLEFIRAYDPYNVTTGAWTPDTLQGIVGVVDAGNLASLQAIDGDSLNVSETTGTPGQECQMNFTNSELPAGLLWNFSTFAVYDGSPSHNEWWSVYNGSWNQALLVFKNSTMTFQNETVQSADDWITNGVIHTRVQHAESGNINHDISIDYMAILPICDLTVAAGQDVDYAQNGNVRCISLEIQDNTWNISTFNLTVDNAFIQNGTILHDAGGMLNISGDTTILKETNYTDMTLTSSNFYVNAPFRFVGGSHTIASDLNITADTLYNNTALVVDGDLNILNTSATLTIENTTVNVTGNVFVNGTYNATLANQIAYHENILLIDGGFYTATSDLTQLEESALFSGTFDNNGGSMSGDILINKNTTLTGDWNTSGNLFIGLKLDASSSNYNLAAGNLTILSTGEFDARAGTHDISENWRSNGAFIGTSALELNGVDEYLNITPALNLGTSNTINIWYYYPGLASTEYIFGGETDGALGFRYNGASMLLYLGSTGDSSSAMVDLTNNSWNQISLVRTSTTTVDMYINGFFSAELSNGAWAADPTNIGFVGRRAVGLYAETTIGRVEFYNIQLTPDELRTNSLKQCSDLVNQANLISCYQFDEGFGTNVSDFKGTNDGITQTTAWADTKTFDEITSLINIIGSGTLLGANETQFANLTLAGNNIVDDIGRNASIFVNDTLRLDGDINITININMSYCRLLGTGTNIGLGTLSNTCGLDAPLQVSPVNQLFNTFINLSFIWNESTGATNYIVYIYNSSSDIVESANTPNLNHTWANATSSGEGNYTWEVFANGTIAQSDSSGNASFKIDVTSPTITWVVPSNVVNQTFVDNVTMNITVSDNNLFGTNNSIINSTGDSVFFEEISNIVNSSFTWTNNTGSLAPGLYRQIVSVSDDHTLKGIDKDNSAILGGYEYTINDKKTKIYTDNKDLSKVESLIIIPMNDRYQEKIEFANIGTKTIVRYVESADPITIRQSSKYTGHIVIGDGIGHTWVDFENDDPNSIIQITRVSSTKVKATITTNKKDITFKSIGGVNVVTEEAYFIINLPLTIATPNIFAGANNYTNETLFCNSSITDTDAGQTLTMNATFYENGTAIFSELKNCANGEDCTLNLSSSFTTKTNYYNCSVWATDGFANTSTLFSTNVTIVNAPPSDPVLSFPANNTIQINLSDTISFTWVASTDIDLDSITYGFQLDNDSDFSTILNETEGIATNTFVFNTSQLTVNTTYYWKTIAVTEDVNSSFATPFQFNFTDDVISCNMFANVLQFGNYECDNLTTNGFVWDTDGFNLTVGELANITGSGSGINASQGDICDFGSMYIGTDAFYHATSSNTTITTSNFTIDTNGTLLHNNGTFIFNSTNTHIASGTKQFWNIESQNIGTIVEVTGLSCYLNNIVLGLNSSIVFTNWDGSC